jgi:3-oxoacyl-[acyl-carrier protein] reductase
VAAAQEAYGRLDGALVSVGGPPPGSALGVTDAQWQAASTASSSAPSAPAAPWSAGCRRRRALALVLSTSVKAPISGLAASNGLRPGLAMLAKTMADELGPQGVRVNGLLPGRVLTDRLRELGLDAGEDPQDIPLRRYGDPAEFGRVAAFVLSPAASYVTGTMISVDGGYARAL